VLRLALCLSALTVAAAGCRKPPKPIPPPPPMCVKVEHGKDVVKIEIVCAQRDSDGDGIDDAVDNCPTKKEIYNNILDRDGCPDPDMDLDTFVDTADACPEQGGGPPDGCPAKDSDNDSIADHLDACPNQAEDIDGEEDADGCPEGEVRTVASARSDQLWKTRSIEMRRGSSKPTKAGRAELDFLTDDVIARTGELIRVKVIGWSTQREASAVARRRIRYVRRALVNVGLAEELITEDRRPKSKLSRGRVDVQLFVKLGDEQIREVPETPQTDAGPAPSP
jgi:hypothetical protein